ncbi:hypothetical protein ACFWOX_11535 [Streptomyces sp. NPDC058467]|uniref:hypothetical protein n=1 Tax=Streptomyces sp. NPDC058467 TaxID=3346513 RepID=UPI00364B3C39
MLAVIVAVGVIAVVAVAATSGNGKQDKKSPDGSSGSTSRTPVPSLSIPSELPSLPSEVPSVVPSLPSDIPSGVVPSDLQSLFPTLANDEVPYYMLKKGDCFDTSEGLPGQAAKRSCTKPHDAEVVKMDELKGSYTTDAALKKAASALCESTLQRKAAKQRAGTVRGTLVQYPDASGYKIGIDNVACSLAADVGKGTHKLTKPLT